MTFSENSISTCVNYCRAQSESVNSTAYALSHLDSYNYQKCSCITESQLKLSVVFNITNCGRLCDSNERCGGKEINNLATISDTCTQWKYSSTYRGFNLYSAVNLTQGFLFSKH